MIQKNSAQGTITFILECYYFQFILACFILKMSSYISRRITFSLVNTLITLLFDAKSFVSVTLENIMFSDSGNAFFCDLSMLQQILDTKYFGSQKLRTLKLFGRKFLVFNLRELREKGEGQCRKKVILDLKILSLQDQLRLRDVKLTYLFPALLSNLLSLAR